MRPARELHGGSLDETDSPGGTGEDRWSIWLLRGNRRSASRYSTLPRLTGQPRTESLGHRSQGISRMQADAYRRARKLLSSRRDYVIARVLGFVQSLLLVALLGIIALFVALLASRGEARFPASKVESIAAVGRQPRHRRRPAVSPVRRHGDFPADRGQPAQQEPGPSRGRGAPGLDGRALPGVCGTTAGRSRRCWRWARSASS